MKKLFMRFVKDDTAATAIEYGLIAAGISVAIIALVNDIRLNSERQIPDCFNAAQIVDPQR